MVYLGIDAGFSLKARSAGVCVIDLSHGISVEASHVRPSETMFEIRRMLRGRIPTAIGIDGALVRKDASAANFHYRPGYRECERLLSGGILQSRCKPGSSNSPRGKKLHAAATTIANILSEEFTSVRIVEAFPNAFLGVLLPDSAFGKKILRRKKSDVFWDWTLRRSELMRLVLEDLFPKQSGPLHCLAERLTNHDERAAFICAVTSRGAELRKAVSVGNVEGSILLPPRKFISMWAAGHLESKGVRVFS